MQEQTNCSSHIAKYPKYIIARLSVCLCYVTLFKFGDLNENFVHINRALIKIEDVRNQKM